jgi:hypothetical protein
MRRKALWIGSLALAGLLLNGAGVNGQCSSADQPKAGCCSGACIGAAIGAMAGGATGCAMSGTSVAVPPCCASSSVPACEVAAPPPCPVVDAAASHEKASASCKLAKELVAIMNETQSPDTFCVVLGCLERTKVDCEIVVPAIIRNAERMGLLKDLMSKDGPNEKQQRLCEILDTLMKAQKTGHKTKMVKKTVPNCCSTPPAPTPCYSTGGVPVSCIGGAPTMTGYALPLGQYLQHPPQYVPPTNEATLPPGPCPPLPQ